MRAIMKRKLSRMMLAAFVISFGAVLFAGAQDDEGPTSSVKVVVVRDTDGKPIKYAHVVLHPVNRKGKSKGEMDLKTDVDGRVSLDGVPYGSLEIQVIAKGFQTFGQDYELKQPNLEITVKLKQPGGQYSTYENHDDKTPPQKPQ